MPDSRVHPDRSASKVRSLPAITHDGPPAVIRKGSRVRPTIGFVEHGVGTIVEVIPETRTHHRRARVVFDDGAERVIVTACLVEAVADA